MVARCGSPETDSSRWQQMATAMAAAVLEVAADGTLRAIFGELPDMEAPPLGTRLEEILHEHSADGRSLVGVVDGSAPARGEPFELRTSRGQPIPVLAWSTTPEGNPGTTLVAIRRSSRSAALVREQRLKESLRNQIAEVEQLRLQLDELEAIRTHFLSASAHELKTPLTVIQSYLETLVTDLAPGLTEEQHSFLRIAYEGVLRLRRLVLDLVDLAALSSGKIRLDIDRVELGPLVSTELNGMQALAKRSGVELKIDSTAGFGVARADPARVQQVIRNLIDNAIKFTPAGGSVTVTGASRGDSVVVSVADTGIGIPAERLPSIFDEFFQAGSRPGHPQRGAGLGLAISRRIVRSLGGRIDAASVEDEGSTFAIYLPQWPEDDHDPPAQG